MSTGEAGTGEAALRVFRPRSTPRKAKEKASEASRSVEESREEAHRRDVASTPEVSGRPAPTEDRSRVLDELEAGIDDLIYKLMLIDGSPEILAALRQARRILYHTYL
jgi:hypothetical protein